MTLPANLLRMAPWAHALLAEALPPGGLAIDLTAGNGHDTSFLQRLVGDRGRVLAFDVQAEALQATAALVREQGAQVVSVGPGHSETFAGPGVYLVHDCHSRLADYLAEPAAVIVANLGYLPGGDPDLATACSSTLTALCSALELLAPGGRLAVVCYTGHPGGAAEAERVERLFGDLPAGQWDVLQLRAGNRHRAPTLLVVERRRG